MNKFLISSSILEYCNILIFLGILEILVLSDNINGTWGTLINDGGLADENTEVYNDFTYVLPDPSLFPTYNIENLSLIAYLCDRNTYEVIQVIKSDI